MKQIFTTPGKTYAVTSKTGCTVTTEDGLTLAEVEAGKQGYFVAVSSTVLLSDDSAVLTQLFKLAPQQRLALLGVLGGDTSDLPAGYRRVEWLESPYDVIQNSTARFDLGMFTYSIAEGDTIRIQTKHRVTSIPTEITGFAGKEGFSNQGTVFQFSIAGHTRAHTSNPAVENVTPIENYAVEYDGAIGINPGWDRALFVPGLKLDLEWHVLDAFMSKETLSFALDSDKVSVVPFAYPSDTAQMLTCFGVGENTNGRTWPMLGQKQWFKFWLNGELQRDLIPCLDPTGAPCMFDLVSKTPFYNAGIDDFRYPTESTTYSLRRVLPDWGKLTEHGLRRLYHAPAGYKGEMYDYALENGFKPIVEPERPEEGYWVPRWTETEEEIVLEWVETEPPMDEFGLPEENLTETE